VTEKEKHMEADKVEVLRRLAAQAASKTTRCKRQLAQAEAEEETINESLSEAVTAAKADKGKK
jgi:hypothetical protein